MRSSMYFGLGALVELERRAALVVALVRALAGEEGDDLVRAGLQVAEVDALHAAAVQRLHFERRVEVVGDDLVVELDLHRVELEQLAHVHRHEQRHLRVGREQQFLLEHQQVAVEADHVALDVLDAGVERPARGALACGRGAARRPRRGGRGGGAAAVCASDAGGQREREAGGDERWR